MIWLEYFACVSGTPCWIFCNPMIKMENLEEQAKVFYVRSYSTESFCEPRWKCALQTALDKGV
jgi:hypothetical protein